MPVGGRPSAYERHRFRLASAWAKGSSRRSAFPPERDSFRRPRNSAGTFRAISISITRWSGMVILYSTRATLSGSRRAVSTCCKVGVHDLIAAENQKLDTLKTQKKGLMQQMFPPVEEVDA